MQRISMDEVWVFVTSSTYYALAESPNNKNFVFIKMREWEALKIVLFIFKQDDAS